MKTSIAIIGELDVSLISMVATPAAIEHVSEYLKYDIDYKWISSRDADGINLGEFGGIWLAPGGKYADSEACLRLITIARQNSIPCFGTCRGFQYMILEFAKNVLGHKDAGHEEDDPKGKNLFLTRLPSVAQKSRRLVEVQSGSLIAPLYPRGKAMEKFYGSFGVNGAVESQLTKAGFVSMASEYSGNYRVAGIPIHPFFIGSLFLPQMRTTRFAPHPLVTAFLKVAIATRRMRAGN